MKKPEKQRFEQIPGLDPTVLDVYAQWVNSIWNWHPKRKKKETLRDDFIMTVGLGGETGEVLEILKKKVRSNGSFNKQHLQEELGDVLYYLVKIANSHGITFEDILVGNYLKLEERLKQKSTVKKPERKS